VGWVPNLDTLPSSTPVGKAEDYHIVLKTALKQIIEVQKFDGIKWVLTFRSKEYTVVLKLPVLFIICDTEGADKLCARYLNRTKVNYLCHYCNIPTNKTSDPHHPFKYIHDKDIFKLVQAVGGKRKLQELSHHCIPNAFRHVCFGGCPRGIHGNTIAELLHVIQSGLHVYAIDALFQIEQQEKGSEETATNQPPCAKRRCIQSANVQVPVP
jgi:hypothetical protein